MGSTCCRRRPLTHNQIVEEIDELIVKIGTYELALTLKRRQLDQTLSEQELRVRIAEEVD